MPFFTHIFLILLLFFLLRYNIGKKNDSEITLNVSGGASQTFKLEGKLYDTKVVFDSKLLQLGTIAVGNRSYYNVKLKNTGRLLIIV